MNHNSVNLCTFARIGQIALSLPVVSVRFPAEKTAFANLFQTVKCLLAKKNRTVSAGIEGGGETHLGPIVMLEFVGMNHQRLLTVLLFHVRFGRRHGKIEDVIGAIGVTDQLTLLLWGGGGGDRSLLQSESFHYPLDLEY